MRYTESGCKRFTEISCRVLADLKPGNFSVMIMPGRNWLNCLILILYIYVTPWDMAYTNVCLCNGEWKTCCCEVPIARTIDEAWQLVETSERTKKHCMMLENCCYDFFELLTLNMARQGMFGDIIHGEGAYIHNLLG